MSTMRITGSFTLAVALLASFHSVEAWIPSSRSAAFPTSQYYAPTLEITNKRTQTLPPLLDLHVLASSSGSESASPVSAAQQQQQPPAIIEFSDEDMAAVKDIIEKSQANGGDLNVVVMDSLPTMQGSLILKLRQSQAHPVERVRQVATELESILQAKLLEAKSTLESLMNAGEIRKLDSLIGKNAKQGNLDAAFFNVLTMNLQDATAAGDATVGEEAQGKDASRAQILQHIYTRCQEEVEKNIPPATALLNLLLRTDQESIRSNLYKHYMTPQQNTKISTPDGKTVELTGTSPVLLPIVDFVDAIGNAIKQIRTVEQAGATDRESAAVMVESCRMIAKETRRVIGEHYGVDSKELLAFEEGLQPVFRPASPDSPYIKGD